MRPRHKAAENALRGSKPRPATKASMRPRHKAAENLSPAVRLGNGTGASMRPRHKAAENVPDDLWSDLGPLALQ